MCFRSGTTTGEDTWYTYLNSTWYPSLVNSYGNLFTQGTYYMGALDFGENYKLSICDRTSFTSSQTVNNCTKTSQSGTFNAGLLRYGEMFASQQSGGYESSINMWLITPYNSASYVWVVFDVGSGNYDFSNNARGVRPSINLKSDVKIISGTGTESDPYVVGLS